MTAEDTKAPKKPKAFKPPPAALPPEWNNADAAAWQAIHRGDADERQQQRALKWLLDYAAGLGDNAYRMDGNETAFFCGRQFVGQQVKKMILINLNNFKENT